jgi:hypothetical protein
MVKLSCPNNWIVLQTRLAGPRVLKRKLLVLCFIFWIWEQIFGNCKFSDRLNIYIYKYKYIYIYCISDIYIYIKKICKQIIKVPSGRSLQRFHHT